MTHSMTGLTVCGGYSSPSVIKTCEVLRNREWIVYEDVMGIPRKGHNSWMLPDGKVLLMNGNTHRKSLKCLILKWVLPKLLQAWSTVQGKNY